MKFRFQNSPYFPSYGKNWPSYSTKRKDNFNIGPAFTHFYLLKMKLHNPVCLKFCVVTWSIFHIGRKVRWVLKSKFCGLYNGYQKFLCTCSRTRENNENKVKSDLWDTLYKASLKSNKYYIYINYASIPRRIFSHPLPPNLILDWMVRIYIAGAVTVEEQGHWEYLSIEPV